MEVKGFDEIAKLWREDPAAAEAYHREVIEDFIDGLPDEERKEKARHMMWRINTKAATFKDPKARLNYVFLEMWESFLGLNNVLNYPVEQKEERPKAPVIGRIGESLDI